MQTASPITLYTIGHSDRSESEFCDLLLENDVQTLVDIRAMPSSARFPQFNAAELRETLEGHGLVYHWAGRQLGGKRTTRPGSPHLALEQSGLQGFADYMESDAFGRAIAQLQNLAGQSTAAIMCAEGRPENCHRSLIADFLILQGWNVVHILGEANCSEHLLRPEARRESAELIYDRKTTAKLDLEEIE